MNLNNLSAKKICRLVSAGMVFSMLVITGIFGGIMQDIRIFIVGGTLTLCAFFWIWLLVLIFGKRLSHFTSNLCRTLDNSVGCLELNSDQTNNVSLFVCVLYLLAICSSLSLSKLSCLDFDLNHLSCSLSKFHIHKSNRSKRTSRSLLLLCFDHLLI